MSSEIWKTLDLAPVRDREAIRRAYARRLKVTNPEDDPEAFQTLRAAYDQALASLDWDWAWDGGDAESFEDDDGFQVTLSLSELHAVIGGPIDPMTVERPASPTGDEEHARLVQALEALVLAEPRAESVALEAALAAVVASPAMEALDVATQTERLIAYLIAHNAPRSDALVRPAINAFRWSHNRVRTRHDGVQDAVLDRDADIIFRTGLLRDDGARRTVFLALSRPLDQGPAWWKRISPTFGAALRTVLNEIDTRHPSLVGDIDPESLAYWRARAARPRLPAGTLVVAGVAPLAAAVVCLFAPVDPLGKAGAALVGGVVAVLAAACAWTFGLVPLRRLWRDHWAWRAPSWTAYGWAPASIALLLLAALAPVATWATILVGLCAAVVALWAVVTSEVEIDTSPGAWPLLLKLLVSQGLLAVWWGALMAVAPAATPPALTAAFVGAAIASAAGAYGLPVLWYRHSTRPLRFALVLGLAGAMVWTVLQLLDPSEATGGVAMAAAATAAVVLAHRPLSGGLGPNTLQWRYRVQAFSLLGIIGAGAELGWLKVSGLWLLAGVAVALIGAIVVEKDL